MHIDLTTCEWITLLGLIVFLAASVSWTSRGPDGKSRPGGAKAAIAEVARLAFACGLLALLLRGLR